MAARRQREKGSECFWRWGTTSTKTRHNVKFSTSCVGAGSWSAQKGKQSPLFLLVWFQPICSLHLKYFYYIWGSHRPPDVKYAFFIFGSTTVPNSRRWWRTGKPGVLRSMGWQRVRHDLVTEQQQQFLIIRIIKSFKLFLKKKKNNYLFMSIYWVVSSVVGAEQVLNERSWVPQGWRSCWGLLSRGQW